MGLVIEFVTTLVLPQNFNWSSGNQINWLRGGDHRKEKEHFSQNELVKENSKITPQRQPVKIEIEV